STERPQNRTFVSLDSNLSRSCIALLRSICFPKNDDTLWRAPRGHGANGWATFRQQFETPVAATVVDRRRHLQVWSCAVCHVRTVPSWRKLSLLLRLAVRPPNLIFGFFSDVSSS